MSIFTNDPTQPVNQPAPAPALPALVALVVGIVGDLMLRVVPWGINAPIWTAVFVGAAAYLLARMRPAQLRSMIFPGAAALALAAGFTWRDSSALNVFDFFLLVLFLNLIALGSRGVSLWSAGVMRIVASLVLTAVQSVVGLFQVVFVDMPWKRVPFARLGKRGATIVRGVLMAVPLLIVFGALLVSADEAFSLLITRLFAVDLQRLVGHIVVTMAITVVCAGFFRSLVGAGALPALPKPSALEIGAAELNIALGLVDVLFATFVAVQFRYFFGGIDTVLGTPQLTMAQYARRGFFELFLVAALVVPLLLVASWLVSSEDGRGLRRFRIIAFIQILLVLLMCASALDRMRLYARSFGLTEQRLYTTAFMFWLCALLLWLAATALIGRGERFIGGAVVAGLVMMVSLHALNPDALIVRQNIARQATAERALDALYLASLSADAVPPLLERFEAIPVDQRPCVAKRILARPVMPDWRNWNAGRATQEKAVAEKRPMLEALATKCSA